MRWSGLVLALALAACGDDTRGSVDARVEVPADADDGFVLVCSAFGAPELYPFDVLGDLAPDELEAYQPRNYVMWVARRPDTSSPFGAQQRSGVGVDRRAERVRLSADGLRLFWLDAHFTESPTLYEVRRLSRDEAFLPRATHALVPPAFAMDVTGDARTVYYSVANGAESTGVVYVATRPALDMPFGASRLLGDDLEANHIAISPDERELFHDRRGSVLGVYRRVRTDRGAPWGPAELVAESSVRPTMSGDGTKLSFFRDGVRWMMTRTCERR